MKKFNMNVMRYALIALTSVSGATVGMDRYSAVVLPVADFQGESYILLGKETRGRRPNNSKGYETWNTFGGKCNPGEERTPWITAAREFKEESWHVYDIDINSADVNNDAGQYHIKSEQYTFEEYDRSARKNVNHTVTMYIVPVEYFSVEAIKQIGDKHRNDEDAEKTDFSWVKLQKFLDVTANGKKANLPETAETIYGKLVERFGSSSGSSLRNFMYDYTDMTNVSPLTSKTSWYIAESKASKKKSGSSDKKNNKNSTSIFSNPLVKYTCFAALAVAVAGLGWYAYGALQKEEPAEA